MKYFDELLTINKKYFPDGNNIRIKDLEEIYNMLDKFYTQEFNLDEFIILCIKLFSTQIFYDGNFRTALAYLIIGLNNNGYYLDIDKAIEDLEEPRDLFPTLYDSCDELDDDEILRIKNFIYLKKDSKGKK